MQGIKDKFPHLPERISGLREPAYNLWWSWHPEGRALFKLHSRWDWYLSNDYEMSRFEGSALWKEKLMRIRDAIKLIEANGWYLDRTIGSHRLEIQR
jgi:hypothetical protein